MLNVKCFSFQNFYGRKPHGLSGALQDLGIKFSGRQHSGLDDARNTARLTWRMIQDGCVMNVTKSLDGVGTETGWRDPIKLGMKFQSILVHLINTVVYIIYKYRKEPGNPKTIWKVQKISGKIRVSSVWIPAKNLTKEF